MQKTPLETWISENIGGVRGSELTLEGIRRYQLERLRSIIDTVREKSPFYRDRLRFLAGKDLHRLEDLSALPLTTQEDLRSRGPQFLCTSQSQVERVITLQMPGSEVTPLRIAFTPEDLERTVDFFHRGMTTLAHKGQKVLILLPGDRPGSVGDLLARGLHRAGIRGFVHGIVRDPAATLRDIADKEIDCLVGIPTQVLALARHEEAQALPAGRIKSVLLSADYVPTPVIEELQRVWQCKVFSHYGTTEMGLGGGVECDAHDGYHLREADLLFEIVDPGTGRPLPVGQTGEIVFTTLTRTAMPLIRYRTGDLSRFLPDPCPCGTLLPRLGKVRGKLHDMVLLGSGDWVGIADLDEALFTVPGIVNYNASLTRAQGVDRLGIVVYPASQERPPESKVILNAVAGVPAIANAAAMGQLIVEPVRFSTEDWITTGVAKRAIVRQSEGSEWSYVAT